uniref:SFR19-like C-terminal domain-containing protein n=1 Tax=Glossina brevipalpis TaxID=37001 RepID=A0A1A9WFT1_9MUSC
LVGKSDDLIKVYDDVPNSAVELQVKDKFLRKLNRQERVVEEVKLVLKPRFNKKQITKEDYKEIMRRAVPKICHSKSGEIDPHKIKNLIDAYVKKFRAKHKKLNLANTGQNVLFLVVGYHNQHQHLSGSLQWHYQLPVNMTRYDRRPFPHKLNLKSASSWTELPPNAQLHKFLNLPQIVAWHNDKQIASCQCEETLYCYETPLSLIQSAF